MTFWENVDEELKFLGMERKELGKKAGFPESYISKGISRKSCPQADLAIKIASVLEVSVEYRVNGSEGINSVKNYDEEQNQLRLYRKHSEIIKKCEELSSEKEKLLVDFLDKFAK